MDPGGGRRSPAGSSITNVNETTPGTRPTNKNSRKPSKRGRGFAFIEILSSDSSPDVDFASPPRTAKVQADSFKNDLFSTKTTCVTKADKVPEKEQLLSQTNTRNNAIANSNLKTPPDQTYVRRNNSFTKFTPPSGQPICRSSNSSDTGWLSRKQAEPKAPDRLMLAKQIDEKFKKFKESETRAGWLLPPDRGYRNVDICHDSDSCNEDVAIKFNSMNQSHTRRKRGRRRDCDQSTRIKHNDLEPKSDSKSNANDIQLTTRPKRGRRRNAAHHHFDVTHNSGSDSDPSTNHKAATTFNPKNWRGGASSDS
jgi:hypothetical protein